MNKNSMSWKNHVDYWDKLNADEKEWLRAFNREWGLGYFDKDSEAPDYYKRERWQERHAERRDLLTKEQTLSLEEMRVIELQKSEEET